MKFSIQFINVLISYGLATNRTLSSMHGFPETRIFLIFLLATSTVLTLGVNQNQIVIALQQSNQTLSLTNQEPPTGISFEIDNMTFSHHMASVNGIQMHYVIGGPKNTMLSPGEHILMGFPQYKQKGIWHIMLDNGLNRLAEIYFSQKDADTLHNKMNQSFAAL